MSTVQTQFPRPLPFLAMLAAGLALMTTCCSAPEVRSDAVRDMVQHMDERVDAYAEADAGLDPTQRAHVTALSDHALELLAGATAQPGALQAAVEPLWQAEVAYTLADPVLTPPIRATFLRSGLLVLTVCTRAQGLPDPAPPIIPGMGPLEPQTAPAPENGVLGPVE